MAKKEKRFVQTHVESSVFENTAIWVDRETGVNYLWHSSGEAGGMTPLLDRDENPVITEICDEE